ncbi:hypothetical protein T439DRAFT_44677 [Meredithblackwellia eburnea MCA 4105]
MGWRWMGRELEGKQGRRERRRRRKKLWSDQSWCETPRIVQRLPAQIEHRKGGVGTFEPPLRTTCAQPRKEGAADTTSPSVSPPYFPVPFSLSPFPDRCYSLVWSEQLSTKKVSHKAASEQKQTKQKRGRIDAAVRAPPGESRPPSSSTLEIPNRHFKSFHTSFSFSDLYMR